MLKVAPVIYQNQPQPTRNVLDDVMQVSRQIPPLWDLENYVAVNPFLGFSGVPLVDAACQITDGIGAQVLPPLAFYREQWAAQRFGPEDLVRAARRTGYDPAALQAILEGTAPLPQRQQARLLSFAERYDLDHGTQWDSRMTRTIANWCAVRVPVDGSAWAQAAFDEGLYASWQAAAQVDRSLEIAGLKGWREWVMRLPNEPLAALEQTLRLLQVRDADRPAYLYRLLAGVFGWAAYLRRDVWAQGDQTPGPLLDLLAMRVCADAAVAQLAPRTNRTMMRTFPGVEDEAVRAIFQDALEDGYTRGLFAQFQAPSTAPMARPAVQAVFCIDVRSEVIRRHLEACTPTIETLGFAGFFAVFLDWQTAAGSSARCPVLLQPGLRVQASEPAPLWAGHTAVKQITSAPAAAYTFVETLGLGYALNLLGDALHLRHAPRTNEDEVLFSLEPVSQRGISLTARVDLAALILKNMGLRERFGRLILLVGHEGRSENNPHQAGLDCGACGGHGGAINARIAAAVLNDPQVRAALPERGYQVPEDTHFLPGLHDTSTDEVRLLDLAQLPASHQAELAQVQRWLTDAAAATRRERAASLGISPRNQTLIDRLIGRRARDWSEVRPEWALARNAAFIAARRTRTRGQALDGRTFLHEYDWQTDPDNSILTLILTAPMVVASWINLQYFASTVDNQMFGCGTKTLHNRIGTLGVVLGNDGDLRTGLALQSVQGPDGRWYHEPLRLQVVVEAPHERIEAVLAAHTGVRDLIANGWVRLFALDPASNALAQWTPDAGWR